MLSRWEKYHAHKPIHSMNASSSDTRDGGLGLLQLLRQNFPDTVLGQSKVSSHSVSADGIVSRHNFHCIWSRRRWKSLVPQTPRGFVLIDPQKQQLRISCRSSCMHASVLTLLPPPTLQPLLLMSSGR